MMKRMWRQATGLAVAALAAGVVLPAPAEAQIMRVSGSEPRQAVVFHLGYFGVRGEDSRVDDDVLAINLEGLAFDIGDFNGAIAGADWIFPVSDYLEGSVGASFYQRTVPSVYRDFVRDNGAEIEQDLKLRMFPMTAMVRFLPAGRGGTVEPYVGGGIALVNWRYTETGEFVDFAFDPPDIFRNTYEAKGNAVGGVLVAGLRVPSDVWLVGGEFRYQRATGDTDSASSGLLGDKIDLGGWSANFTLGLRF
jgi:hypothetical protein